MKNESISKKEASQLIRPNLYKHLEDTSSYKIQWIDPCTLISHRRLDLIPKILFLESIEKNQNYSYFKWQYLESIRGFKTNFSENDGSSKVGPQAYVDSFLNTYETIKNRGFLQDQSLIVLSRSGEIIDGAHRVASAILAKKKVAALQLDIEAHQFSGEYFTKNGVPLFLVHHWKHELIYQQRDKTALLVLFPAIQGHRREAKKLISEYGKIIHSSKHRFNTSQALNFLNLIYQNHEWTHSNNFYSRGLYSAYTDRFSFKRGPCEVFFVNYSNEEEILELKKKIRTHSNLGNPAIHSSTEAQDILDVSSCLHLSAGRKWLSLRKPSYHPRLDNHLSGLEKTENLGLIKSNSFSSIHQAYSIDSGACLAAFGIRDAGDLDYISSKNTPIFSHEIASQHNEYWPSKVFNLENIVHHPNNFFFFRNIKFCSLPQVFRMKLVRHEKKDLLDCGKILSTYFFQPLINFTLKIYIIERCINKKFEGWF